MIKGFKFNYTAKEKALKEIEKEAEEKEAELNYQNVMLELGIEVVR